MSVRECVDGEGGTDSREMDFAFRAFEEAAYTDWIVEQSRISSMDRAGSCSLF